jgi:RNA ligase
MAALKALVLAGETNWKQYGEVYAAYSNDLVLFNYTALAQYSERWNWFELNSRGLILNNKTGEVVALPFPKFFNWGESGRTTNAPIQSITEKIDGSLGILYRLNNEYRIATRGAFESEQALWGTQYLNSHFDLTGLESNLTLLFEIVYPANHIVVHYGDREDLVLIGARNRFTGETLPIPALKELSAHFGFNLASVYDFGSIEDVLQAAGNLKADYEGWVATFADGSMFKFKGAMYQLAHRFLTGVTFNQVLQAVANGQFDGLIEGVPDEFLVNIREYKQTIDDKVAEIVHFVTTEMQSAPKESRKEFALWAQTVKARYASVMKVHPSYFFAAFDNKPLEPLIYKHEFE